jgi:ribosomal protein S18 acetylase RimI-like enzyme
MHDSNVRLMRQIQTPAGVITIRPTTEADVPAVRATRLEALTRHPEAFGTAPEEIDGNTFTCNDNMAMFVAATGDRFVGLTGIYRGKKMRERHRAGIWSVYVADEFRGHGIAGALLETAVDWAKERDVKIVHLMVTTTNTSAITCYHRCGFRISGVEHATIRVGETCYDEFHMYRWINGER